MIVATVVALFVIRTLLQSKRTLVAGATGSGTPTVAVGTGHHWYQKPTAWFTLALWLIGVALLYLLAQKYWKEETEMVWGVWIWGSKENLWITVFFFAFLIAAIAKSRLTRQAHVGTTSSYESRGEGKRGFSLGAAIWVLIGVALLALLCLKVWHEFEFGFSNAPERFAERGYVPREQVAAALAAAAPALPEVHTVIAPPLASDGKTNWSESVLRASGAHHLYFNIPDDAEPLIRKRANGIITNFAAETRAQKVEFCSVTNAPFQIKWWQSTKKLTPEEIRVLEER